MRCLVVRCVQAKDRRAEEEAQAVRSERLAQRRQQRRTASRSGDLQVVGWRRSFVVISARNRAEEQIRDLVHLTCTRPTIWPSGQCRGRCECEGPSTEREGDGSGRPPQNTHFHGQVCMNSSPRMNRGNLFRKSDTRLIEIWSRFCRKIWSWRAPLEGARGQPRTRGLKRSRPFKQFTAG